MGYVNMLWNTLGDATGPLTKKSCSGCLQIGIPHDTSSNLRYGKDADKAEFYLG